MLLIIEQFKEQMGVDLLLDYLLQLGDKKLSFKDRALNNQLRRTQVKIKAFLETIQALAKGVGAQELSEWDAAKRIGIGTIVGKYHQRALALKGFTVDMFKKVREDFAVVFKSTKLEGKSDQEESVITL